MSNNPKKSISTTQPSSIEIRGLTRNYRDLVAVDHVDLEINQGEIFGLLGPNGAGKTTLISMLTTLLKPTAGTAKVAGFDVEKEAKEVRKRIGVVFQNTILEDDLTAWETLDIHARLYNLPKGERKNRVDELLRLVHLEDRKNDLVGTFSGGMKRRLEVAKGVLHNPEVLFLDEPTVGLDPQSREVIWNYIKQLNEEAEVTTLITTHYMDEADNLCHRIALIDYGKIIALGSPNELKGTISAKDIIKVKLGDSSAKYVPLIKDLDFVEKVDTAGDTLIITAKNGKNGFSQIIQKMNNNKAEIRSIYLYEPTLNDVFLHYTGREIKD